VLKKSFLLLLFISLHFYLNAQDNFAVIQNVEIIGNKRTKTKIILRELDLFPTDSLYSKDIKERFFQNEKRLLSTGLFTNVSINLNSWDPINETTDIEVVLQENWYIYPSPIFELADRNFNVWWNEQGRSLSRVNYGLRLTHINASGNRDRLKLVTQFGYTKKYELEYFYPYLNNDQTLGIGSNIFYSENNEIGYITIGNKTLFHQEEDERILLRRFRVGTWLNYRPDLFQFHTVKLEYHRNSIDEFVAQELNPDYFLNAEPSLRFFKLEYDFSYDKRHFTFYPLGGFLAGFSIKKEGLGIFKGYNALHLEARAEWYKPLSKKLILANKIKVKTNAIRSQIAFANNTGLGYGDNIVNGYELYVIDGQDFLISQSAIRFKLIDQLINLGGTMPLDQFKLMGLQIYLTFNLDSGYVNEGTYRASNFLNNQWFVGYGPGVDILLFNTYLLSFEYSFNELGESALYFTHKVSF